MVKAASKWRQCINLSALLRTTGEDRGAQPVGVWLTHADLPPLSGTDDGEIRDAVRECAVRALTAGGARLARSLRRGVAGTTVFRPSSLMEDEGAGFRTRVAAVLLFLFFWSRGRPVRARAGPGPCRSQAPPCPGAPSGALASHGYGMGQTFQSSPSDMPWVVQPMRRGEGRVRQRMSTVSGTPARRHW